ncbi:glycosyltransferase family 2 protein [Rhizobium sp. YIM 134829]|uniref:glycosyltransferase family 2 protein n=1 Tax=Rhizobium sp. YIM 134829 TaxID=3390453 RepID=UPI00397E2182
MAIVISVPAVMYGLEIALSFLRATPPVHARERPATAIIVPAHDEESGIRDTVLGIRSQMRPGDRLLVVADNCRDRTAAIAREAGAEVVERHDDLLRGKGYALDAGIRAMETANLPYVVFIDADCWLDPDALDELLHAADRRGGAVQGVNLMIAPAGADIKMRVAELAFRIKNKVRPLGLARMGLGCHLTGSAMAVPFPLIRQATVANGNLVEDMKLGLDLAAMGRLPTFCESARVFSYFPHTKRGTATQRQRWESGHLALIAKALRTLTTPGILLRPRSVLFILDLVIPPLSLLLMILSLATIGVGLLTALLGLPLGPLLLLAGSLVWFLAMTVVAWIGYGLSVLPLRSALQVFPYIFGKLPLYVATLLGRKQQTWIRTDRSKGQDKA